MTKFHPIKVRHCNPIILIYFIWIWRCHPCFCSKGKFSDTICKHLIWISSLKIKLWLYYCWLRRHFLNLILVLLRLLYLWLFKTRVRSIVITLKASIMTVLLCSLVWCSFWLLDFVEIVLGFRSYFWIRSVLKYS